MEDKAGVKRRKVDAESSTAKPADVKPITSANQLRSLLFSQQAAYDVKQGVRSFKDFLTSINDVADPDDKERSKKLKILKAYCDSQSSKPAEEDQAAACFPDLTQIWSSADNTNNEALLSLVPSVLALFLKIVSTQLEFRDFGSALCKWLLQKDQLRLFNRAFTATKTKEHLISPCIRLLTEIVSFDGGANAKILFARRDTTLKRLETWLSARKTRALPDENDNETETLTQEERRKPSLRRNAQRYLIANFKVQSNSAKEELIGNNALIRAFLEDIRKDASDVIIQTIQVLDRIVGDTSLPRNAKSRLLNRHNLERLVTLYGYEKEVDVASVEGDNNPSVVQEVHQFLLNICTKTDMGVLLFETGWYPTGSNPEVLPTNNDDDSVPLGLDSPLFIEKYQTNVPIRNGNLSALAHVLRAESDTLQMQLLLKIFRVAPELVYDFFSKKTMFISDPKPNSPTWLGESAFLFSIIQLPVPANCGWKEGSPLIPPPCFIAIESILPRPLTQKIMTRCLNQNTEIVTIFAIRILTLALRKLHTVIKLFQSTGEATNNRQSRVLWTQATFKLTELFCQRFPRMRDITNLFRSTSKNDVQQQTALLELIATLYEVLPTVALEETFDITLTLVDVLGRLNEHGISAQEKDSLLASLEYLLVIARQSTTLRWWKKPESLEFSAFTSVLKVLAEVHDENPLDDIKTLVQDILIQDSVLSSTSSFDGLLSSLGASDPKVLAVELSFLDNCITRIVKKPVVYLDLADNLRTSNQSSPKCLSLLVAAIVEQWPFVVKAGDTDREKSISEWIFRLLPLLASHGEDPVALAEACNVVSSATENKKAKSPLKKALKKLKQEDMTPIDKDGDLEMKPVDSGVASHQNVDFLSDLEATFGTLPVEPKSHNGLIKWDREDIEIAVDNGYAADLILCLCSEHEEVRRQAAAAIPRFMQKIRESSHSDNVGIYIISGEVLETARRHGAETPLPYIAGELAVRLLSVIIDPLHALYAKANKFLNKGPCWEIGKIPSYWIDKILYNEPEYDNAHKDELSWLLGLFVHGLRTNKDLDIYRRANVFERLFTLYNASNTINSHRRQILHLIHRACEVDGRNATTLLTRSGVLSWIQGQVAGGDANREILRRLAMELWDRCDREWIDGWSRHGMNEQMVAEIAAS